MTRPANVLEPIVRQENDFAWKERIEKERKEAGMWLVIEGTEEVSSPSVVVGEGPPSASHVTL